MDCIPGIRSPEKPFDNAFLNVLDSTEVMPDSQGDFQSQEDSKKLKQPPFGLRPIKATDVRMPPSRSGVFVSARLTPRLTVGAFVIPPPNAALQVFDELGILLLHPLIDVPLFVRIFLQIIQFVRGVEIVDEFVSFRPHALP